MGVAFPHLLMSFGETAHMIYRDRCLRDSIISLKSATPEKKKNRQIISQNWIKIAARIVAKIGQKCGETNYVAE